MNSLKIIFIDLDSQFTIEVKQELNIRLFNSITFLL